MQRLRNYLFPYGYTIKKMAPRQQCGLWKRELRTVVWCYNYKMTPRLQFVSNTTICPIPITYWTKNSTSCPCYRNCLNACKWNISLYNRDGPPSMDSWPQYRPKSTTRPYTCKFTPLLRLGFVNTTWLSDNNVAPRPLRGSIDKTRILRKYMQ